MERMANREQNSNEKRARLAPALFVVVLLVSFVLMNVLPDGEAPAFLSAAMAGSLGDSAGLFDGVGFDGGASADLAAVVWQILREGALAAVALVAVAVAVPSALHWSLRGKRGDKGRRACGQAGADVRPGRLSQDDTDARLGGPVRSAAAGDRPDCPQRARRAPGLRLGPGFVAAMLAVGLLGGAFSVSVAVNGGALFSVAGCVQTLLRGFGFVAAAVIAVILGGPNVWSVVLLLAVLALLTGLFEEAFMRVLGTETVVDGLRTRGVEKRREVLLAAVVTSAIFALLHVGAPAEGSGVAGWLQMAGRFLQTGLFGFCMAGLYEQSKSLWPCALLHAGFNLLYLNVFPFVPDMTPVYGSGALSVSVLLAMTTICLAPLAVRAHRVMAASADE
jgi:membrane protease YdiL (CAAX protease family)